MAVGNLPFPELPPLSGVRLGTAMAGIKKPDRRDMVVIELPETATVAGVFTRNAFCAAPVVVAKQHLEQCASSGLAPRYWLINTGNAVSRIMVCDTEVDVTPYVLKGGVYQTKIVCKEEG